MQWDLKPTEKLWWHQEESINIGYHRLMQMGYFWLQAGCATGKTLASLMLAHRMRCNQFLVFTTQAAATDAWKKTVEDRIDGLKVVLLSDPKQSVAVRALALLKARADPAPKVVVVNYEAARLMADKIAQANFPMVIADECHKLKSHDSGVSQKLALATAGARYRVGLTGTPWEDRPTDVFGQVRWLNPGRKPSRGFVPTPTFGTWTAFFEKYVTYIQLPGGIKKPTGYKNIDDLRAKISGFSLQLKTEDIFSPTDRREGVPALPPEQTVIREVQWQPDQRALYNALKRDKVAHGTGGAITIENPLTMALRLREITSGYYRPDGSETITRFKGIPTKVQAVLSILEELGGQPVVIFTMFTEDVTMLTEVLEAEGYKNIKRLVGGTHEHQEFQRGEGQILIANMQTGAEGVTLNRARYGIFYSIGDSRTAYTQARWRIRRPGMDEKLPVTYFHLQIPYSVDTLTYSAILGKGDVATEVADGLLKL